MSGKIKVGVIGVGALGRHHARLYIIFGELGMSRFRYRENRIQSSKPHKRESRGKYKELLSPYGVSDSKRIDETLCDALISFDYPQFDADMPSVCALFEASRKKGRYSVYFEDAVRNKSLSYAYERQDRLGALFGISAIGATARAENDRASERTEMVSYLKERFFSLDTCSNTFLKSVLGEKKFEYLIRRFESKDENNKDTDSEIRILGMLCQCVEWAQSRELLIINSGDGGIQSALSMM